MEHLGKVPCNPLEELWVSLREIQGKPQLELRIRTISASGKTPPLSEREPVLLPIGQLESLLRLLTRAREFCINRGLLYEPGPATVVTMEQGESIALSLEKRGITVRRDPRIPVRLSVECRLVESEGNRLPKPVSGEMRDISIRGAQVWLPQRLPRFKHVDVSGLLDGMGFQARAQIANVGLESNRDPTTGFHRHGLQWVAMEPKQREILTTAITKRSESAQGKTPSAELAPVVDGEESPEEILEGTLGTPPPETLERRRAARVPLPQPVPVRARGEAAREVRLLDLSLIGSRIEHQGSLQPGSLCVLDFPIASSPLALSARVIHSRALGDTGEPAGTRQLRYESGLTFVDVTPDQQTALARIVEWLALGGTVEGILTSS
ncbi:MAG TPA: PilZ domain-containing protein [Candidatus Methylomirabilis sp.]|nr:PilZ domain-containing protein [Candidatus Methylomirabilis sp.]